MNARTKFNKCITQVSKAHDLKAIDDVDIEKIVTSLDRNIRKHIGDDVAINKLIQKEIADDMIEHNKRIISTAKQIKAVKTKIATMRNRIAESGNAYRVVQGDLTGNSWFKDSIALKTRAALNREMQALEAPLKKMGVLDEFFSGKYDAEIAEHIFAMDRSIGYDITKKDTAISLAAKHYKLTNDRLNADLAKNGIFIDEIEGYIKQFTDGKRLLLLAKEHKRATGDIRNLQEISYELWREDINDKIDWEKMDTIYDKEYYKSQPKNSEVKGVESLLKEMHRGLFTTVHGRVTKHTTVNAYSTASHGTYGMPNITKRERKIFFKKEGQAYKDYAHKYSGKSLPKVWAEMVEEKVRLLELVKAYGPNYQAGYERVINTILDDLSRGGDAELKQLNQLKETNFFGFGIENHLREVTGEAQMVVSQTGAFFGKAIRGWQTVTHLGMGFLSQQLDRPIFHSILTENGIGTLQALTANLSGYARRMKDDPESRVAIESLGAGLSTLSGGMAGRMFGDPRQKLGKGMEWFMKWSGMKFHDEAMRYTAAGEFMGNLGARRNQSWKELPSELKRIFKTYDIDSKDWDIARATAWELPKEIDMPVHMVSPDRISDVNVRNKFAEYYTGEVETAVLTPTDREAAALRMGTKEGELMNNIVKSMGQFKSFPIAMLNNVLERQYAKHGAAGVFSLSPEAMKGHLSTIALAAQMTVVGMLVTQVREILKGREPKPFDEKFVFEAFVRGGGAAILGDVMLTEYDRHYRHPLTQIAGPSLGDLAELSILTSEAVRGELTTGAAWRFARQNTPVVNIFYIKPIVDTLFLHSFEELIRGDGHFERTNRILKQKTGAGFSETNPISPLKRVKTFE